MRERENGTCWRSKTIVSPFKIAGCALVGHVLLLVSSRLVRLTGDHPLCGVPVSCLLWHTSSGTVLTLSSFGKPVSVSEGVVSRRGTAAKEAERKAESLHRQGLSW